jgi:hypothetical protein
MPYEPVAMKPCYIQRLFPELLVEIFRHCLPRNWQKAGVLAPLFLGRICRQWRDITLSASGFWTSLRLRLRIHGEVSDATFTQLFLERAGDRPLQIYVSAGGDISQARHLVLDTILSCCDRWEHIELSLPQAMLANLAAAKGRIPWLQHLVVRYKDIRFPWSLPITLPPIDTFETAPSLRHLELEPPEGANFKAPWSQLTTVIARAFPLDTCMDMLVECPNVEKLLVLDILQPEAAPRSPIQLTRLRMLEAETYTSALLDQLLLPALVELKISITDVRMQRHLISLLSRSSCSLLQLYLGHSRLSDLELIEVLQKTPSLIHLDLDGNSAASLTDNVLNQLTHRCADFSSLSLVPKLTTISLRCEYFMTSYGTLADMIESRWQMKCAHASMPCQVARLMNIDFRVRGNRNRESLLPIFQPQVLERLFEWAGKGLHVSFNPPELKSWETFR